MNLKAQIEYIKKFVANCKSYDDIVGDRDPNLYISDSGPISFEEAQMVENCEQPSHFRLLRAEEELIPASLRYPINGLGLFATAYSYMLFKEALAGDGNIKAVQLENLIRDNGLHRNYYYKILLNEIDYCLPVQVMQRNLVESGWGDKISQFSLREADSILGHIAYFMVLRDTWVKWFEETSL